MTYFSREKKTPEKLAVQLELILADMEKESTASSHKSCVVSSVHLVATHLTEMKTILGQKDTAKARTHL